MGLDMYLRAEKYVSGWGHGISTDEELNEYERLVAMFGMEDFVTDQSPSGAVEFTIGYWRKANQIHSWFVRECQGGVDECQRTEVSIDKLKELRDVCLQVLASTQLVPGEVMTGVIYDAAHPKGAVQMEPGQIMEDPSVAFELLEPQEGFFFGNVDYNEWYWEQLQHTLKVIDKCIALDKAPGYWSFIYQSSW